MHVKKTFVTRASHLVPHGMTRRALWGLTSWFEWIMVFSSWYERMWWMIDLMHLILLIYVLYYVHQSMIVEDELMSICSSSLTWKSYFQRVYFCVILESFQRFFQNFLNTCKFIFNFSLVSSIMSQNVTQERKYTSFSS